MGFDCVAVLFCVVGGCCGTSIVVRDDSELCCVTKFVFLYDILYYAV